MASLNIIYYSATGNTEEMAKYIAQGAKDAGADVKVINVEEADENSVNADFLAFGSPIESNKDKIFNKTVGLFGSYDWGTGVFMESWIEQLTSENFSIVGEGFINHLAADDDEKIEKCKEYGRKIVL